MRMRAIDPLAVEVGQSVVVGIPEDTLLQASVWMYLIPLLGLIGGAVLPSVWGGESGIAVIFSIIGFAGGLLLARNKSKQEINNLDYYPKILRIESLKGDQIPLVFTP
jgi:sigma-E factor negative regulatory protein RseC